MSPKPPISEQESAPAMVALFARLTPVLFFGVALLTTGLMAPLVSAQAAAIPDALPNVVFILADDIGPGDVAVYHRERTGRQEIIPTVNLDQLPAQGLRFRDAHSPAALCAPTRYSVMTGNYPQRCRKPWGVWGAFEPSAVGPGQQTVAQVMKDARYHTAFFGKWNLGGGWNKMSKSDAYPGSDQWDDGYDYSKIVEGNPNQLGFDYSLQLPAGIQQIPFAFYENGQWLPLSQDSEIQVWKNPWDESESNARGEYVKGDSNWKTERVGPMLARRASEYIKDHRKREDGAPFFIYYCAQAVHLPHEPPTDFWGTPVRGTTLSRHGDMIFELDLQVGMIVAALKEAGVFDNTLIVFTSDNGGLDIIATETTGHDSSNGFRGSKKSMYEGGHRVPFIVSWPGMIPAGKILDEPIQAQDLMATLYAVTRQNMPADQGMDSFNLLPLLSGEPGAKGRKSMLLQAARNLGQVGIREGDWKLIINSDDDFNIGAPFALFDLRENATEIEAKNLINDPKQQARIAEMLETYQQLQKTKTRTTELVNAAPHHGD